jgi:large subunit ribosomal protein L7/L12
MALDKAKIVEELSNATVIEIADLVKELETKWGVTAAAPVAARRRGAGAAAPGRRSQDRV